MFETFSKEMRHTESAVVNTRINDQKKLSILLFQHIEHDYADEKVIQGE